MNSFFVCLFFFFNPMNCNISKYNALAVITFIMPRWRNVSVQTIEICIKLHNLQYHELEGTQRAHKSHLGQLLDNSYFPYF